ncbi:MAG: hypothetical protein Fur0032_08210 [Terrimicrobiaceae bacterium]
MRHELTNHSAKAREIGVWSLAAVPGNGRVVVQAFDKIFPLGGQPIGAAAFGVRDGTFTLNFDAPIHPYILRAGLFAPRPAFDYTSRRGPFRSSVESSDGSWSPPGINLLFYTDVSPLEAFAEVEHLGPLRNVAPGESPLEVPLLAALQAASPDRPRSVEITFTPELPETPDPQMLIEIGGSGDGCNLWIQNGRLHAGVRGKNENEEVEVFWMHTGLPAGSSNATLELDPVRSEARLLLNGQRVQTTPLPRIQPHRDRCALGGVAGSSRLPSGPVRGPSLPLHAQLTKVLLYMEPAP